MVDNKVDKRYKFEYVSKTRKKPKGSNVMWIICIIITLVALLILFWNDVIKILPYRDETIHKYMIGSAKNSQYIPYKDIVAVCGRNGIVGVDGEAKEKWRINEHIDNPVVSTSKAGIVVASKGGKTVYVISQNGSYREFSTNEQIQNVKIADSGDVVTITDKNNYNGSVSVYNKLGMSVFTWSAGTCNLIDAALSADGNRVALTVADVYGSVLKNTIMLFDISKSETPYFQKEYEGNLFSTLKWSAGGLLTAVGDENFTVFNQKGEVKWNFDYGEQVLNFFDITNQHNLVFVTGGSSLDRQMTVHSYDISGKKNGEYLCEYDINNISASKDRILISSIKEVALIDKYGKLKDKRTAEKEIYNSYIYESRNKVFINEGGFAEILMMK